MSPIQKHLLLITNPVVTLEGLIAQLEEARERILTMDGYEWGKASSFVGSTLGLDAVNPLDQVAAALGAGLVVKVNKYVISLKLKNVKLSESVKEHMLNPDRYVPLEFLKDVIKEGNSVQDPMGSSAKMYRYIINKNGKEYDIEVLYEEKLNEIWHFKYYN